ncbi:MAG: type IX secretion system protein PorQ [Muribaculaceae bacterium]
MKKSNKIMRVMLAVAMTAMMTLAQAQDGTTAYNFLNVSPSSHVYGLGGHNISLIDDDVFLTEQNPALLGPEIEQQVGLNYMRYIGGCNFMGARYGMGINDHSAWAASIQYFGYGNMNATDVEGVVTGTFSASDMAFGVTYSHDITDNLRGGINLNVLYSNYESYSAVAIAADLGVNYYNPESDFSASLVLKSLGGQVKKFSEHYDKLPWDIQLGFTKGMGNSPFRLSVTATNLTKWKLPYLKRVDSNSTSSALTTEDSFGSNLFRHLTFAGEFTPSERIYIGLGYNYKTRTDMSTYARNFISGFSVAAGMKVRGFGFGIALAQPHSGATTFMLNLTTTINELMR